MLAKDHPPVTLLMAPREGLLDFTLRDILTRIGGVPRCVSEFIRITDTLLPERVFTRLVPELLHGSQTAAGVPVRPQLLGSDPVCLADNAARLASMGPDGVDLNFGCPSPVVNRHRGGAALLDEPELLLKPLGSFLLPGLTQSGKIYTPCNLLKASAEQERQTIDLLKLHNTPA